MKKEISNKSVFAIVCRHFISDYSLTQIEDITETLLPFAEKLVNLNEENKNAPHIVAATILHDYRGLKANDPFFLPRLS